MNFFASNPLNRLSWLRPSHTFLNAVIISPETRWILFNAGDPLTIVDSQSKNYRLAYLITSDVLPLLGPAPFFGQGEREGNLKEPTASFPSESARLHGVPVIFLGLHENGSATATPLLSSDFNDPDSTIQNSEGTPYFALDVAPLESAEVDNVLKNSTVGVDAKVGGMQLDWTNSTPAILEYLDHSTAGIFAQARTMVDWNRRNKFCPACGAPTYSAWGGWKLSCTSLLPWFDRTGRKPCVTEKGEHNFSHPRTDVVVIMVAIDVSGEKILLGRNRKFSSKKSYSALAGFLEPGESFEAAVQREMLEEAGVDVWNVRYHSTQPWPYPANLMVGFYATADASKPVRTDLDNELDDAQWYTRDEVLAVLRHPLGTKFAGRSAQDANHAGALAHSDSSSHEKAAIAATLQVDEPPFRVPPATAIAGVLIRDWAESI